MKTTRILAVMTILAVVCTAVPAFAGRPPAPPRMGHGHYWGGSVHVVPPPPVVYRHRHYPPVYVPPPVVRHYLPPRGGYYVVPGRYYYGRDRGVDIGVYRGGFGLHIGF